MAMRLGTALTPLPQWCTTLLAGRPASNCVHSDFSTSALLKCPSGVKLSVKGRFKAPGMWPAIGSSGSTSPR